MVPVLVCDRFWGSSVRDPQVLGSATLSPSLLFNPSFLPSALSRDLTSESPGDGRWRRSTRSVVRFPLTREGTDRRPGLSARRRSQRCSAIVRHKLEISGLSVARFNWPKVKGQMSRSPEFVGCVRNCRQRRLQVTVVELIPGETSLSLETSEEAVGCRRGGPFVSSRRFIADG